MSTFFRQTIEHGLLSDAPAVFDWLLSDERFTGSNWDSMKKRKLTNRVKRLNGFGDTTFMKKTNDIAYPVIQTKRNRKRKPYALFSSSGSLGQDFVRHVRSAIAHGRVEVYKSNGSDYLEMTDIRTHGQTGYIAMPVNYSHSLYRIYLEVSSNCQSRQKGKRRLR